MGLTFGSENLSESARQNFVGMIIEANYPCDCDDCLRGKQSLESSGQTAKDNLHIQVSPAHVYDKTQNEWLVPSKTKISKWGAFNGALDQLGITKRLKSEKDLVGMVFEFESQEVKVGFGDKVVQCWVPIREVNQKEFDKLSEESAEGTIDFDDDQEVLDGYEDLDDDDDGE